MSARESIENLWDRATPVSPLLDAFAHELAEKIRADLETRGDWKCCAAARRDSANIIDPGAQT